MMQADTYALGWPRWALITFGVISVVLGVLALLWPGLTILALVIVLGIELLIWGVMLMVNAFREGEGRILAVILGVLALIAGIALFFRPLRNLPTLVIVISVFWILGGLVQAIGSIVDRGPGWGWLLFSGLVSVAAGLLVITWPEATLLVVAVTAGIWMIVLGVVRIAAAFTGSGTGVPPTAVAA
jgi:uncharacterized membrane protein HdeD (DUF308 family)